MLRGTHRPVSIRWCPWYWTSSGFNEGPEPYFGEYEDFDLYGTRAQAALSDQQRKSVDQFETEAVVQLRQLQVPVNDDGLLVCVTSVSVMSEAEAGWRGLAGYTVRFQIHGEAKTEEKKSRIRTKSSWPSRRRIGRTRSRRSRDSVIPKRLLSQALQQQNQSSERTRGFLWCCGSPQEVDC